MSTSETCLTARLGSCTARIYSHDRGQQKSNPRHFSPQPKGELRPDTQTLFCQPSPIPERSVLTIMVAPSDPKRERYSTSYDGWRVVHSWRVQDDEAEYPSLRSSGCGASTRVERIIRRDLRRVFFPSNLGHLASPGGRQRWLYFVSIGFHTWSYETHREPFASLSWRWKRCAGVWFG